MLCDWQLADESQRQTLDDPPMHLVGQKQHGKKGKPPKDGERENGREVVSWCAGVGAMASRVPREDGVSIAQLGPLRCFWEVLMEAQEPIRASCKELDSLTSC